MRGLTKYIILLFTGSVIFFVIFAYLLYQAFHIPSQLNQDSVFLLPEGQGLIHTSCQLEEERLITNRDIFKFGVILKGEDSNLKAGEFLIPAQQSMDQIMKILVQGKAIQHSLTIPEGWTSYQIVEYLNSIENLSDTIEELPIEGSILPDTYNYINGASRIGILSRMQKQQQDLLKILWGSRDPDLPLENINEAIILASIVERETGLPEERRHIAGVFINRLLRSIRLQSDPTVIYGINKKGFLSRGLKRSELNDNKNFYNTYKIDGLPPSPIAHPGKASIEAVLHPMLTDDIYFVADGTGGHAFAVSLNEHQKNVREWRKIEATKK